MIEKSLQQRTLTCYEQNNLVQFLNQTFGMGTTAKLLEQYSVGTVKLQLGANVFWYLDGDGNAVDGRIACYEPLSGRPKVTTDVWVSGLQKHPFDLSPLGPSCFYGYNLLKQYPNKPVALVDDERTAIICSHFLPQYVWLSERQLSDSALTQYRDSLVEFFKDSELSRRQIIHFPSLSFFNKGSQIPLFELMSLAEIPINTSYYLRDHANQQEKAAGMDIADFLIRKTLLDQEHEHVENLSPAEQLKRMIARNPCVGEIMRVFNLELVNEVPTNNQNHHE